MAASSRVAAQDRLGNPEQSQGLGDGEHDDEVKREQQADLGQHLAGRRTIASGGRRPMVGIDRARQGTDWQSHGGDRGLEGHKKSTADARAGHRNGIGVTRRPTPPLRAALPAIAEALVGDAQAQERKSEEQGKVEHGFSPRQRSEPNDVGIRDAPGRFGIAPA
jgi:hypothetical protein